VRRRRQSINAQDVRRCVPMGYARSIKWMNSVRKYIIHSIIIVINGNRRNSRHETVCDI
jgi:hypothetical protein